MLHCIYKPQLLSSFINKGHSGNLHVLTTVNNAALNMGVKYLFELVFLFPLDIFPEVKWLDYTMILLFFNHYDSKKNN